MRIFLTVLSVTFMFTLISLQYSYADGHEAAAEKDVDVEALEIKEADSPADKAKEAVEKEVTEGKEKVESEAGKKVDSMKEGEIEKAMESAEQKVEAPSDKMENVDSTVVEEKMDSMTEEVEAVKDTGEELKEAPVEMKKAETMEEKVETEPTSDQESKEGGDEVPSSMVDSADDTVEDAEMMVEEEPVVPVVEKEVLGSVVSMGPNTITVKNERDNQNYLLSHEGLESVKNVEPGYRVEAVYDEANNGLIWLKVLGVPVVAETLIIKTEPK